VKADIEVDIEADKVAEVKAAAVAGTGVDLPQLIFQLLLDVWWQVRQVLGFC
jgi:hypothetical protein